MIDAPQHEEMTTALVINVDQAQSEIIAVNTQRPARSTTAKADVAVTPAPVTEAVPVEKAQVETPVVTAEPAVKQQAEKSQQGGKRASNDPRQRRRQQREHAKTKTTAPKLTPSQVPTLGQYTVGSLIRHVYGDDCAVLIEQFGLIPTFNRALQKFTDEYAETLSTETVAPVQDKKPVTRDAVISKAAPEAEPAPMLDLTPPAATEDNRVANDPRERRRLAKLAAEQAHEQTKQVQPEAKVEDVKPEAVQAEVAVTEAVVAPAVAEAPAVETPAEVEAVKATEPVQTELAVDQAQEAPVTETVAVEKVDAEVESAEKAEADKPARPRRPRGRPPKKAPVAE